MPKRKLTAADYIQPLNINGLEGRMLRLPAPAKYDREILFIYGQHSSLERWFGLTQVFSKYGTVTAPDLPGLGGMQSFYTIGRDASIDNMADYLAAFIKLKYKNKKITIVGMSLGFVITTRMLQKYPEMTKKVEMLISVVGWVHEDDFIFSRTRHFFYKAGSSLFARRVPAWIFQHIFLRPSYLRRVYSHSFNAKEKFANLAGDEFKRTMDTEIELWTINDIRTQMRNSAEMLRLDHTKQRIDLPVYHVASKKDRYFDNVRVEEHMRRVFNDFFIFYTTDPNHAPTIIADEKSAAPFVPEGLRKIMAKSPTTAKKQPVKKIKKRIAKK